MKCSNLKRDCLVKEKRKPGRITSKSSIILYTSSCPASKDAHCFLYGSYIKAEDYVFYPIFISCGDRQGLWECVTVQRSLMSLPTLPVAWDPISAPSRATSPCPSDAVGACSPALLQPCLNKKIRGFFWFTEWIAELPQALRGPGCGSWHSSCRLLYGVASDHLSSKPMSFLSIFFP